MINLVMAVLWAIAGVLLLGWQLSRPEFGRPTLWSSDLLPGWVALLLALYNLVRWWSVLSKPGRTFDATSRSDTRAHEPEREPDPTFNFNRESPPDRQS
jgi:hypothetical protein